MDAGIRQPFACPDCKALLRASWFAKAVMHVWSIFAELLMFMALFPIFILVGGWWSGWVASAAVAQMLFWVAVLGGVATSGFVAVLSLYPIQVDGKKIRADR